LATGQLFLGWIGLCKDYTGLRVGVYFLYLLTFLDFLCYLLYTALKSNTKGHTMKTAEKRIKEYRGRIAKINKMDKSQTDKDGYCRNTRTAREMLTDAIVAIENRIEEAGPSQTIYDGMKQKYIG